MRDRTRYGLTGPHTLNHCSRHMENQHNRGLCWDFVPTQLKMFTWIYNIQNVQQARFIKALRQWPGNAPKQSLRFTMLFNKHALTPTWHLSRLHNMCNQQSR